MDDVSLEVSGLVFDAYGRRSLVSTEEERAFGVRHESDGERESGRGEHHFHICTAVLADVRHGQDSTSIAESFNIGTGY